MPRIFALLGSLFLAAATAMAQDPVKVDPRHHGLPFENEQVRVLRIIFGRHEKSVMPERPNGVRIYLAGVKA